MSRRREEEPATIAAAPNSGIDFGLAKKTIIEMANAFLNKTKKGLEPQAMLPLATSTRI